MARTARKTSRKSKSVGKTARRSAASRKRSATTRKRVRKRTTSKTPAKRRWSKQVTEHSDALDLRGGVFTLKDPKQIAASLKRSAQASRRRKSDPYRSAVSMLTFYINRGGKNLPASRRKVLERAKGELRRQFGRD